MNTDSSEANEQKWCVAIIGMNAVGKSRLGKRIASKLGLKRCDSDTVFTKEHGNPQEYIKNFGWETFRKLEEEIVLGALQPGYLIIIG